jgi:hypothetical protein
MMKNNYIVLFLFLICFSFSAFAESTDKVKVLMTSKWISKYKKLKKDIENKASTVKDMDQIDDSDYNALRNSYSETSKKLEVWLLHLENTLEKGEPSDMEFFASGVLNPALEKELQEIGTFYANDFSTLYEEITGIKSRCFINLSEDNAGSNGVLPTNIVWKFEHEELSASLQPLRPLDWNSLN